MNSQTEARVWWGEPTRRGGKRACETYERVVFGRQYRCTKSGPRWIVLHVSRIGAVAFAETSTLAAAREAVIAHGQQFMF